MRPVNAPGRDPGRTTLHDEGCGDVTATQILESFSRHFLTWLRRWQDTGFDPIRSAWVARASELPLALSVNGEAVRGAVAGIADDGAAQVTTDGATRSVALAAALDVPSWSV
jgi:biotin-(acetyl-CoA carboxylase) ligase